MARPPGPYRRLTPQRVPHARRLLEETRLGADEIARDRGFGTAALPRHHFRRGVGVTPTDDRRTFSDRTAQPLRSGTGDTGGETASVRA